MPVAMMMDNLAVNTIRMLSVNAVQQANSGHPGTPKDAAPAACTPWERIIRYKPVALAWPNRGAADLAPSTQTDLTFKRTGDFQPQGPLGKLMPGGSVT